MVREINRGYWSCRFNCGLLAVILGCAVIIGSTPTPANHSEHPGAAGDVQLTFGPVGEMSPALSPNGKWLAFEYFRPDEAKNSEIWIMSAHGKFKSARPLVATAYRNADPTWSPDGRWISFMCAKETTDHFETDNVCKVNAETGASVRVTHFPVAPPGGGIEGDIVDWLADGRIAFRYKDSIYVASRQGKGKTELVNLGVRFNLGASAVYPGDFYDVRVSPNEKRIAFMYSLGGEDEPRLAVVDLKTGMLRHPLKGVWARFPAWINNDCLLYTRGREGTHQTQIWALCLSTGKDRATD